MLSSVYELSVALKWIPYYPAFPCLSNHNCHSSSRFEVLPSSSRTKYGYLCRSKTARAMIRLSTLLTHLFFVDSNPSPFIIHWFFLQARSILQHAMVHCWNSRLVQFHLISTTHASSTWRTLPTWKALGYPAATIQPRELPVTHRMRSNIRSSRVAWVIQGHPIQDHHAGQTQAASDLFELCC